MSTTTTASSSAGPAVAGASALARLVNASAGKRLAALAIDTAVLVVVWGVVATVIAMQRGAASAVLPATVGGAAVTVLFIAAQWWGEATRGRTLGGAAVGIRTVGAGGAAPGWGRALVRGLIVLVSWIVPVIGPLAPALSCLRDRDRRRQGWHDKAAGTWVLDVALGRDPLPAGGAAPGPMTAPTADRSGPSDAGGEAAGRNTAPDHAHPGAPAGSPAAPTASTTPAAFPAATSSPAAAAATPVASPFSDASSAPGTTSRTPLSVDADEDLERTRLSRPRATAWRLAFDDGSALTLRGEALVGRNPQGAAGATDVLLVNLQDPGRSVSKTHAHLAAHADGVWVTDRGSTNGTAVTAPTGERVAVEPGVPLLAGDGALVHVGDRTIVVTRT